MNFETLNNSSKFNFCFINCLLSRLFSTFQIISRIDEMAGRIDDLEHNINDLMVQAGQGEGTPAITSDHQK